MNPSYLRVRRSLEDAIARYGAWIGRPELSAPREVADADAIDLALENGRWRGLAVYVFPSGAWTVFEELSGGLAASSVREWLRLADGGDLVFAGYNDAIGYGELVQVDQGQLVRQFLEDAQDPGANVNVGTLATEASRRIARWVDVARWVDDDEASRGSGRGLLWIHQTR